MSLAAIRKRYGVPAYRSNIVRMSGRTFRIIGAQRGTLRLAVRDVERERDLDPKAKRHFLTEYLHPTWNLEYEPSKTCADCGREGVEDFIGPGGIDQVYLCANITTCANRVRSRGKAYEQREHHFSCLGTDVCRAERMQMPRDLGKNPCWIDR